MARLLFLVLVLGPWALASGAPRSTPAPTPLAFAPDLSEETTLQHDGSAWTEIGPGYTLRLRRLSEAQRLEFIEEATGERIDPFGSRPDRAPGFMTFHLEIKNGSQGSISFQSQNCWLVTQKNKVLYPIGIEQLRSTYGMLGQQYPPAYDRVQSAVLGRSWSLEPGGTASGLLVYRTVESKTKKFHVELQLTLSDGSVIRANAPYKRISKKKKRRS